MPDEPITPSRYWSAVVSRACSEFSLATLYRALGGAVFGLIGQAIAGQKLEISFLLSTIIVIASAVMVFLIELLYRLVTTPAKLANEAQAKLAAAGAETDKLRRENEEKDILEIVLESEMLCWTCKDPNTPTDAVCRIGVKNTSTNRTANDVGLSLIALTLPDGTRDTSGFEFNATGKRVPVHGALGAFSHYDAIKRVTIHAKETAFFDVFQYNRIGINRVFSLVERRSSPLFNRFALDETTGLAWQFIVRATGTHLAAKEQTFKLESDKSTPPKFYRVESAPPLPR
jgi:hypothetical protein